MECNWEFAADFMIKTFGNADNLLEAKIGGFEAKKF